MNFTFDGNLTRDVLENVARPQPDHIHAARHKIGPGSEILTGMIYGGGNAGRSAGDMQPHQFFLGHGDAAVWILSAQIVLGCCGDATKVIQ